MDDAFRMLRRLNGRSHEVFSGVCLLRRSDRQECAFVEFTRVHFHQLNEQQLRAYLTRISPLDKAGAYAAQNDHGELIERLEGSFSNVVGLPMERLREALSAFASDTGRAAGSR